MTDREPPQIVELKPPVGCEFWEHPERLGGKFAGLLEEVESYEDSSHSERCLYKCCQCGQLYFYEWWEWVDWDDGNDKTYTTLIPVQTREEIEAMKRTDSFGLMLYYPRLHLDGGTPAWNGKG
jgi:hypothetical protein